MIYGLGIDLCKIGPVRRSVGRFGKAWLDEVFSDTELSILLLSEDLSGSAAVGFAIKEACAKALGTGLADGVRWHDFEIRRGNIDWNVRLLGRASEHAVDPARVALTCECRTLFSVDGKWAMAIAILYDVLPTLADLPFWDAVKGTMPELIESCNFQWE